MTDEDYGVAPVTRHGRLMGIIEREILRSVSLGNYSEQTKVDDLMTPDPAFLERDITVKDPADWTLATG